MIEDDGWVEKARQVVRIHRSKVISLINLARLGSRLKPRRDLLPHATPVEVVNRSHSVNDTSINIFNRRDPIDVRLAHITIRSKPTTVIGWDLAAAPRIVATFKRESAICMSLFIRVR